MISLANILLVEPPFTLANVTSGDGGGQGFHFGTFTNRKTQPQQSVHAEVTADTCILRLNIDVQQAAAVGEWIIPAIVTAMPAECSITVASASVSVSVTARGQPSYGELYLSEAVRRDELDALLLL